MTYKDNTIRNNQYYFILALSFITLFFLQSTRQFLSTICYIILASLGHFSSTIFYLVIFFSPLLMLLLRVINVNIVMAVSGVIIVTHRLYGSLNSEAELYLIFHALVIVSYGLFLPAFLTIYYALHNKSEKYSVPRAVIIAPVIAFLMDNMLKLFGDSIDLTLVGVISGEGNTIVHPILISLPICAFTLFLIYKSYGIVKRELISIRTVQRSGVPVSTIIPGLGFGLLYATLTNLLGYPGALICWTIGDYATASISASLFMVLLIIYLQHDSFNKIIFKPLIQIVGNAIQFFVIIDILYLDTGAAQYLIGIALTSGLVDIFIFYQVIGSKNYSIQYFIRFVTIGIITFLLISYSIGFTLAWPYIGSIGMFFKGKLNYIIIISSIIYITLSLIYNKRVRSYFDKKLKNLPG